MGGTQFIHKRLATHFFQQSVEHSAKQHSASQQLHEQWVRRENSGHARSLLSRYEYTIVVRLHAHNVGLDQLVQRVLRVGRQDLLCHGGGRRMSTQRRKGNVHVGIAEEIKVELAGSVEVCRRRWTLRGAATRVQIHLHWRHGGPIYHRAMRRIQPIGDVGNLRVTISHDGSCLWPVWREKRGGGGSGGGWRWKKRRS